MLITRHPSEAALAAHGAGTMPEGLSLAVATHLGFCPVCREAAGLVAALGGAMLEAVEPVAMAEDALAMVLARAERPVPLSPSRPRDATLPPPLDRAVFGAWRDVAPGYRWRGLRTGGAAWAGLLRAEPGCVLTGHDHTGLELTCVLTGALADASGRYGPGDVMEGEPGHVHEPRVDGTEPCLCVIAGEGDAIRGLLALIRR